VVAREAPELASASSDRVATDVAISVDRSAIWLVFWIGRERCCYHRMTRGAANCIMKRTLPTGPIRARDARPARIIELDGVRGLAIAFVLVYHYANISMPGNKFLYYTLLPTRLMWSGVDLFFVLSGLLIGGILMDNRDSPHYYSAFYARRIYRIFPIYYLMIGILAVGVWLFPRSPLFAGNIPLWVYPLYAQNLMGDFTSASSFLGVTWSLAVEEQFYLLFPAVVKLCSRRTLMLVAILAVIGSLALRTALITRGWDFAQVHPLLPCRADALSLGVLAAVAIRSKEARDWIVRNRTALYCCLLAFFAASATLLKWTTYRYVGTIGYSMLGVMYCLLVTLLLVTPHPLMSWIFRARWLCWLGTVSYCVYLIHQPVLKGVQMLFGSTGVLASLSAATLTMVIALVSWLYIEKPLVTLGHGHKY
jgi:peptidoglycan/LPS O-acetylase OafA/YrhL